MPVTGTYNIPFKSLYSRDVKNLMLAGRNISATHIALGSTRVMATCGAPGQAVGTAAYLCCKYGVTPRTIAKEHKKNCRTSCSPTIRQFCTDMTAFFEGDFSASATSEMAYENTDIDEFMPLERDYSLALMCDTERVNSLEIYAKGSGTLRF